MKLNTRYHNEVEIKEEEILHFEKGIPGFPEEVKFVILPLNEDGSFSVMQSVETAELAFVITSPFAFFHDYDFKLEDSIVEELELKSENDVTVYSILTVEDPFEKTTANLQAPVIINKTNNKAKQVILIDEKYKTKHNLFGKTELHKVKG
ncbi:flagellar assembly protein FliW [Mesobacillus selenatarsenatis]|uniref:Flagellar assembly factor FliW n=1 Tax=Mesobacillus selenatarsenatis TaxID=388741 RepID=A0A846TCL1_9BACI|nr:flagellar assembly protein FliW [Mesobacillus selenatarsenatis]NKE06798.1 flagellar assembly protein FliW [Mesobacillus selenatarsenatis]